MNSREIEGIGKSVSGFVENLNGLIPAERFQSLIDYQKTITQYEELATRFAVDCVTLLTDPQIARILLFDAENRSTLDHLNICNFTETPEYPRAYVKEKTITLTRDPQGYQLIFTNFRIDNFYTYKGKTDTLTTLEEQRAEGEQRHKDGFEKELESRYPNIENEPRWTAGTVTDPVIDRTSQQIRVFLTANSPLLVQDLVRDPELFESFVKGSVIKMGNT